MRKWPLSCCLGLFVLSFLVKSAKFVQSRGQSSPGVPQQCDAIEPGSCSGAAIDKDAVANFWTLRHGLLEATILRSKSGLSWGQVVWADGDECTNKVQLGPLFAVRSSGTIITSEQCKIANQPSIDSDSLSFTASMHCPKGLVAEWSAKLQELASGSGVVLRTRIVLSRSRVSRLAVLLLPQGACVRTQATGSVDGSPVRVGNGRFFLGLEHPLAKHWLGKHQTAMWGKSPVFALVAEATHLGEVAQDAKRTSLHIGAAIVAVAEPETQGRRVFAEYIRTARPAGSWRGPLVHYNSWYDFTSWQDEGFFQGQQQLLTQLRKEPMCEAGALERVAGFEELTRRGVKLDSFLWDDGWDDRRALWTFDREKFPNGFTKVAARAKQLGAGLSVWLSPWGGYGKAKDERVRIGDRQGFETNDNGLSLAGPKYASRFREAVQEFRRNFSVNMFKFDGVAGDPYELAGEAEAMLRICDDIREDSRKHEKVSADKSEKGDGIDSFWINLTTGTWPSPFFLLWVDSIWRGHTDTHVPDWPSVEGLSRRQRWQIWRECIVHELIVLRADLFPLARLMVHGAVLAGHGDALANGLNELTPHDWAQEVWSLAAMGLQLQELYVSAKFMQPWSWDELAAALRWASENSDVLEDAHWVFPADGCAGAGKGIPGAREVPPKNKKKTFLPYAIASFKGHGLGGTAHGRGFLFLRNPRNKPQMVPLFNLSTALELPKAASGSRFVLKIVRRMAGRTAQPPDHADLHALACDTIGALSEEEGPGQCAVAADAPLTIHLMAGEVLVLRADLKIV